MPTLWRKSFRDLLAARWQATGLALLVAVVVALMAGSGRARGMLGASLEDALERLNEAHLDIRCSPTHPGVLEEIRALPVVAEAEERMVFEGVLRATDIPSTPAFVRLLPAEGRPRLNKLELRAGRWPEQGEEGALIDRSVAHVRGVAVGDRIRVQVLDTTRELPVLGVTLGCEHVLFPAHPDFEVPIPGALAVVHLSAAAAAHYPYADRVDSLLFRFVDGADHEAAAQTLLQHLSAAVIAMVPRKSNPSRRLSHMMLRIFDIYMPTVSTVLIGVALALFVMTLSRIVRRQRSQIGTLLAVGHGPVGIALSMLPFSIVPTLIGGLMGAAAHGVIARKVFDAHDGSVGWVPLVDPGPGPEGLIAALACAGVAVLACALPALSAARQLPSRLLRHQSWDALKRSQGALVRMATRLRDVLHLPLHVVLGLTTVLRRRWATLTAAVALAANFAVVTGFLFVHISHNREIQSTFDKLALDGVAYFERPQSDETIREATQADWAKVEPLISRITWMDFESGARFVRTSCLEEDGWISRFPLAEGRPFSRPDAPEIHVDRWTAVRHGLKLGDRFICYPYYSAPEGMEVEVVGIYGGVSMGIVILPLETGRLLYELPGMATGVHVASDTAREQFVDDLRDLPAVESVVYLDDAREHVATAFQAARFVISLAVVLAVIVAVIFLGILASLDASERGRDLAILRSLGWRQRTILGLTITEVAARGYFALLLSLPLSPLMARFILNQIEEANHYRMPVHDPTWVYVGVLVLGLILIPLGAIPAWRSASAMPARRLVRLLGQE